MSKISNSLFQRDKAFLAQLRSKHETVRVNGICLTRKGKREEKDLETVIEAVFCQSLILSELSSTIGITDSEIHRWAHCVLRNDIAHINELLKDVFQYLSRYENGVRSVEYTGFKHLFLGYGCNVDDILDVIDVVFTEFLMVPNPIDLSIINTFCNFLGRLNLPSLDYTDACIAQYLDVEECLAKRVYSQRTVDELNLIIREWFHDFEIFNLKPSHSAGGVAHLGRCSKYAKYKSYWTDARLKYFLRDFPDWLTNVSPVLESYSRKQPFIRVAELRVVPKSITKNRTICMEDPTLQYFQNAVAKDLKKYVSSKRMPNFRCTEGRYNQLYGHSKKILRSVDPLRAHINFFDQTLNQEWSLLGSIDGSYATIDLSNASDTVGYDLVKAICRGTKLLKYISCTRSDMYMLPDGTKRKFRKVYPSGSALCFDIETIVFCSILELAVRRSGIPRTHNEFRVFGDDMIIRPEFLGFLVDLLSELGFQMNTSKSYWSGKFRESCGGEYYNGTSITPMRISRKFSYMTREDCPGVIDNRIEFANRCALYQFRRLRRYLIDGLFLNLRKWYPSSQRPMLPLMIDNINFLYSSEPTNFHLWKNYNSDLQCEDIHYASTRSKEGAIERPLKADYDLYSQQYTLYYNRVQQLMRQGYLIPRPETAEPVENVPLDYEDIRYQLWIDISSAKVTRNLDFLSPDHSGAIRTVTDFFGAAVYHSS